MSRKNNRAKFRRISEHYIQDEKDRAAKHEKRRLSRQQAIKDKEAGIVKKTDHKKSKAKIVVAHPEREKRKMAKMMKKMDLSGTAKKKETRKGGAASDSDSDDSENQEQQMEVDMAVTKSITKKKPLSRAYHQSLKKTLRRKIKDGQLPDMAKLDA